MNTNELLQQNDELKRQTLEIKAQIEGLSKYSFDAMLEERGVSREQWDKWLGANVSPALIAQANSKADSEMADIDREIRSLLSDAPFTAPSVRRNRSMV